MFKPGDKVVVIAGPQKGEKVRTLKNRNDSIFFTNFPVRIKNQHYDAKGNWYAGAKVCLRHATTEEIAAAEKPLRRGDLVEYRGDIFIVLEGSKNARVHVAALTKCSEFYWDCLKNYKRIGSIRKKIKRLKAQMGDGK